MKKIVVIFLALSMSLCSVSCSKNGAKPTLAEAFTIFNDKSLSYDSKLYPYEFSQDEFDNADDDIKAQVSDLCEKSILPVIPDYFGPKPSSLETINTILLIDYVFRPGLQLNQEEFARRFSLIENDIIIRKNYTGYIFQKYVQLIILDSISNDMVNCIVPVLREHLPDFNDKRFTETKEGASSALLTQWMYRDVIRFLLEKGDNKEEVEKWKDEAYERIERWGELVKSFPDD